MYFWRCATETELKERGFKSSNQLERLKSMLKDPPQKVSLKKQGMCEIKCNLIIIPEERIKYLIHLVKNISHKSYFSLY